MIQGSISITKHILNAITNVLASLLILHFSAMPKTMFALKILFNQCAVKEIYHLKINNNKRFPLIAKAGDITSIILRFCFRDSLSLEKIEH